MQTDKALVILQDFIKKESCFSSFYLNEISLHPLKGGKSNATLYKFYLANFSFVLRILPANANELTKKHQILLMIQASSIGLGPKIRYIDPELKGIIFEYIDGRETISEDFRKLEILNNIASKLNLLHSSKLNFPNAVSPFFRFYNFIRGYEEKLTEVKSLKSEIENIEQLIRFFPVNLTPSHLDLHLSNILLTNENNFYLIDWVNGGMSDPYFDLATFAYFARLSESDMNQFLTNYFQRLPDNLELARLNVMLPVRPAVIAASILSATGEIMGTCKEAFEDCFNLIENDEYKNAKKYLYHKITKKITLI